MIKITDQARDKILLLYQEEGKPAEKTYVRVGVKSGGCSGLMYELDITQEVAENDKIISNNGIQITVDKKSYLYLVGTSLEFSSGINGKGFQFINPNANRTCGCGESFSL